MTTYLTYTERKLLKPMQIKKLETRLRNIIGISGMLCAYMLLASIFFPYGLSSKLFENLWKLMLVLLLCLGVIFFPLSFKKNRSFILFKVKKLENFEYRDLILLLLPMTPIVQYIIFNNDFLTAADIFIVISFFLILVLIFAYLIPWFLSIFASRRILMYIALFWFFFIFYMPFFTAGIHNPKASTIPNIIFIIISTLFLANIFVPRQIFTFILCTYFLMNTVTSVLSANSIIFSFPQTFEDSSIASAVENKQMMKKNDIFLLVYESYANYETMLRYGFDNNAQITFLEKNGFDVYHGIYSIGSSSIPSMSKVFNIEWKKFDVKEKPDRKSITGGGCVHNILRKKGYQIHGIFQHDYFFWGLYPNQIEMDSFFPDFHSGSSASVLIEGVLIGSLHGRLSLKGVGFDAYLKKKHILLIQKCRTPKLVYTHSVQPGHSPVQGIIPNEQEEELSLYIKHIKKANEEIRQDVNLLIKNNPDAIAIIAGDHGPHMTKLGFGLGKGLTDYRTDDIDRFDIQDRYGAFLAIRWPEDGYAEKYGIKILQDIFPAVFSYLFNDDTLFERIRIKKRTTITNDETLGVYVDDGMIIGGKDDGKPLFEGLQ